MSPSAVGGSGERRRGRPALPDLDARMLADVLELVAAEDRPLTGKAIRARVRGEAARVDLTVRALVSAGRLRWLGRRGYVIDGGGA